MTVTAAHNLLYTICLRHCEAMMPHLPHLPHHLLPDRRADLPIVTSLPIPAPDPSPDPIPLDRRHASSHTSPTRGLGALLGVPPWYRLVELPERESPRPS
ncbi:hypothetical protein CC80DRAFT_492904 [Byssothecium circinans]|uniref:Uncharacterized protein n=1 Tax=Byssothecium circinans TaxID=147558 RepID=A0A6A5TW88_9PLEO|nr:hypothetical protein CC80DRAFT_492904 [Byssothecium circinans]